MLTPSFPKSPWPTITAREWRLVGCLSLLLIVLTGAPYLYAWVTAPAGTMYTGFHASDEGDIAVYYSYIYQVSNGQHLVKDLFTSEPQTFGTFNIWWSVVGLFSRWLHVLPSVGFHLSRLLMIPVFIGSAYLFLSYFLTDAKQRRWAIILLLFSSGIGAYSVAAIETNHPTNLGFEIRPLDLWHNQAITFNALSQTSHFIASITLTLWIFLLMLWSWDSGKWRYATAAGLLALFYFNFHPYYAPAVFGTLGLYYAIQTLRANKLLWRQAGQLALALAISLPSLYYHYWLVRHEPVIAIRATQNVASTPNLPMLVLGYGFLWLGAGAGVLQTIRQRMMSPKLQFVVIWLITQLVLVYLPLQFHHRYLQGIHFPLVIFTLLGVVLTAATLRKRWSVRRYHFWIENYWLWVLGFLVLLMPSILFNQVRDYYIFTVKPAEARESFYLPLPVVAAMEWLAGQPVGVVFAADTPSRFIPSFAGQPVFFAHTHETLWPDSKVVLPIQMLVFGQAGELEYKMLRQYRVRYVFFSQYEKQMGPFDPSVVEFLELVYDREGVQIYQVIL